MGKEDIHWAGWVPQSDAKPSFLESILDYAIRVHFFMCLQSYLANPRGSECEEIIPCMTHVQIAMM